MTTKSPTRRRSLSYAAGNEDLNKPIYINDPAQSPRKGARHRYAPGIFPSRARPGPAPNTLDDVQKPKVEESSKTSCSSNLSINIHSTDGFGGALTVTDISKIPWGRPGDIVEVRPARNVTGRDTASTTRNRGPGESPFTAKSADQTVRRKDRVKGNFLFKLKGNDEQHLRRLTAVSYCRVFVEECGA